MIRKNRTQFISINIDIDIFRCLGKEVRDDVDPTQPHNFSNETMQRIQRLHIPLGHFKYYDRDRDAYDDWADHLSSLQRLIIIAELPYHYSFDILHTRSSLMKLAWRSRWKVDDGGIQQLNTFIKFNGFQDTLAEQLLRSDGEARFRSAHDLNDDAHRFACNIKSGISFDKQIKWKQY